VRQHREPRRALHQRADGRPVGADDQVALPVPGDRTVAGFGGPFADHHLAGDVPAGALPAARPRHPQRPAGPQAGDQLALERAAALNVKGLLDRLVGDPHGRILGEVDRQPVSDLRRAPRGSPPAIFGELVSALPLRRHRTRRRRSVRTLDHPGQPVGDAVAEPVALDELGRFRSAAINSAFHCAVAARYSSRPPRVAALRRSSRETVDGERRRGRAISRPPTSCARSSAISSRSANDKYLPDDLLCGLLLSYQPVDRRRLAPRHCGLTTGYR
jgi:hypothetical protein